MIYLGLDYNELQMSNRVFGPLFFISYQARTQKQDKQNCTATQTG
jgi:hypothetical protein